MNRCNLSRLLALLLSGISVWKVSANGFALPDQDAFATARGEAFVATANNPSAIYYNPAGITQIEGDNLRGGVYGIYLDPSYRPPDGAPNSGHTYNEQDNFAAAPQIFYTHTLKNLPLSFGLGIYAPFGGNMDWPQDTGFRQVAISGSLKYITINPAVAWKILPSLSIGAGVMVNYVNLKTSQGLLASQSPSINFFDFSGSGWSVGYNAGILWQPIKQISIGANFRSSAHVNLDGRTHYEQQPLIPNSHSSANMSMNFPLTAVAGISYRPTPKWNLEFDANYTDWSSFGTFQLREQNPKPPISADIPVHFDWQGSWMYEFGVTRYFDSGWHVSAGYVFNENSVPNAFYTPLAADMDRDFFSVGGGFNGKVFDCDVACQFGYGPPQTVTGSNPSSKPISLSNPPGANGTYGFTSAAVMLTVGMHF